MTIEQLIENLEDIIECKDAAPHTEVLFRHTIKEESSENSSVDYILTEQTKDGILLCFDDGAGMF